MAIVIARTLILFVALLLVMRLLGKRQLRQLELPELIVAVLVADLGAHPLQDIGIPLMNGLLPLIVLFCCEVLISGAAVKSQGFRALLFGRPCFLVRKGRIDQREMRKNRFSLDELAEELRGKGVTDVSYVEYAILETDGTLNTVLFPQYRPATSGGLGLSEEDAGYTVTLINDGRVMWDNLRHMGRDEAWLLAELGRHGCASPSRVYFMTINEAGKVYFAARGEES